MIGGMTEHDGDPALALHWLKPDGQEHIKIITYGLCSEDAVSGVAELRVMASGCRTKKPLLHAWASPSIQYDADQWEGYWARFESELGLEGQPYVEAMHVKFGKGGRSASHVHRAYLRLLPNGIAIPMSHLAPRQEKLSRIAEFMAGEPIVCGVYNRSVIAALRREGLNSVADAMVTAGLDWRRSFRAVSADERAMTERTSDLAVDHVQFLLWQAWTSTRTALDFESALAAVDLRLAFGAKTVVVITPAGNAVPVRRSLNIIARGKGLALVEKAELDCRLAGLPLHFYRDVQPLTKPFVGRAGVTGNAKRSVREAAWMTPSATPSHRSDDGFATRHLTVTRDGREAVPSTAKSLGAVADSRETTISAIDHSLSTPEQQGAIQKFLDQLFSRALVSPTVESVPLAEPLDVVDEVPSPAERHLFRQLKEVEGQLFLSPTLCAEPWKEHYKARLEALPKNFKECLCFFQDLRSARTFEELTSGTTVTTEHLRAVVSAETPDAIEVIVAHAMAQNWDSAVVRAGTPQWQEALTRAATRSGLRILNDDLQSIVLEEQEIVGGRVLVEDWRTARKRAKEKQTIESLECFYTAVEALSYRTDLDALLQHKEIALFNQHALGVAQKRAQEVINENATGPPRGLQL